MSDTKERILDVAERLFAEQGFANTSLRHIIAEAGVNLAAIHYHFGSKEELLDELIRRRADPVNQARIDALGRLEAKAGAKPPEVEAILRAFLEPGIKAALAHPPLIRFVGRMHAEGMNLEVFRKHFGPVVQRYIAVMRRALPDLPEDEFMVRLRYTAGAMAFGVQDECTAAPLDSGTVGRRIATLIAFLKGGLLAPAAPVEGEPMQAAEEKAEVAK